jgi:Spy/CpxP family protein refolding chaperone
VDERHLLTFLLQVLLLRWGHPALIGEIPIGVRRGPTLVIRQRGVRVERADHELRGDSDMSHSLRFWIPLTAGLLLALAPRGAAARPHAGHGGGPLHHLEAAIAQADLDADTEAAAYALLDEARAARRADENAIREAHEALRALLEQDTPDADAALAQAEKLGALETERRKADLRALLEVRALLGPERWAELRRALRPPGECSHRDASGEER